MAIEVFNRQELKFIISRDMLASIRPILEQYLCRDKHNTNGKPYKLYNLYIDTTDNQLIRRSLDKPVYKEKLRIRSYHGFDIGQPVFMELKKRYKKTTNKRRTKIMFDDALSLIDTGRAPQLRDYMNHQVIRELETTCSTGRYQPKVYITYDREAYVARDPKDDLRITLDSNLVAQRYGDNKKVSLLPDDSYIMEVKTMRGMPLWLSNLLNDQGVYRRHFSKYGTEYHHYLRTNAQGVTYA